MSYLGDDPGTEPKAQHASQVNARQGSPPDSRRGKQSPLRKAVTDSVIILPAVLAAGLMGLITVVVLGKFLTPSQFGNFMLAQSILLLLVMLSGLWINSSLLRLIPQYRRTRELPSLLGTAFVSGFVTLGVVFALSALILLILHPQINSELYGLLWLAVIGTPFFLAFGVIQAGYRATGQSRRFSTLTLVRVLGGAALGFTFVVFLDWGPAGMLAGLIIVAAATVLSHVVRPTRAIRSVVSRPTPSRTTLIDMLSFSAPIVGINVAAIVLSASDRFVIEGYLTTREVGLYSAGYAIAEGGMRLISNVIQLAVNPVAYDSWETQGQIPTYEFIQRLFRFYALIAIPAVVGLSLLSKPIVVRFTTSDFAEGSKVIPFVAVALMLHGYALLMNIVFDARKRTLIPLLNFAAVGVLNVVLNIALVPRYGFEAAAWTTTASYAVLLVLTFFTVRSIYPLKSWGSYLWKALTASAGMALVVLVLRPSADDSYQRLFVAIGAGAVSYAGLLILVRGVALSELQDLWQSISLGTLRHKQVTTEGEQG